MLFFFSFLFFFQLKHHNLNSVLRTSIRSYLAFVVLEKCNLLHCMYLYICIYLSVSISVPVSICLSVYISISVCLSLSLSLSVCLSISVFCLSVCVCVCLSLCIYIYTDHISPQFQSLHWLPISQRNQYYIKYSEQMYYAHCSVLSL